MPGIVILGAGRGSAELIDLLGQSTIAPLAVLDDRWPGGSSSLLGVEIAGRLDDAPAHVANGRSLLMGIANSRNRSIRCEVAGRLNLPDSAWTTFKDPSSTVSSHAEITAGCILYPGARVATGARLGRHTVVYYNSVIHHDSIVGEGVVISSGVLIAGGVRVGEGSYLGLGCMVRDGVTLGRGVLVGMGAVVTSDVPDGAIVVGVPARAREFPVGGHS